MAMNAKHIVKESVNNMLSWFDLALIRRSNDASNYIPFRKTIAEAERTGMNLGDFIDSKFNVPGSTQLTVDKMTALGVFRDPIASVVEIGPGTGRYLEKVLERCKPSQYEIYETATDWRKRLEQLHAVKSHIPDGRTLAHTADASADLVHAHKVFSSLQVSTVCRYLEEMARVTADNGWVVFDVLTEACLSRDELQKWYASGATYANSMLPRQFLIDRLRELKLKYIGDFFIPMLPGTTHYFVFRKLTNGQKKSNRRFDSRHVGKKNSSSGNNRRHE